MKSFLAFAACASTALGASLQSVSGWGSNPTNIQMSIYVPDRLAANPAIIVALHGCGGNAQQMFGMTKLPSYADQYGYIMIYPSTPNQSNCWDVHNRASLTHNAGGDAQGIVNQVNYALQKYNGDASRVFVVGFSSGAMMTNVLAGSYPDVFEAGVPFAGVPDACFFGAPGSTPSSANQTCASGGIIKSAPEWGNFARNSYPGYTGRRTRMQIWHGSADPIVKPALYQEELKQWSNVHGVSFTRDNSNTPQSGITQSVYGDGTKVVGYLVSGGGHGVPSGVETTVLNFFGIPGSGSGTTTSRVVTTTPVSTTRGLTTTTPGFTTTRPPVTTTTSAAGNGGAGQTKWGQCGGIGYGGLTSCQAPATCTTMNPYYAQCI